VRLLSLEQGALVVLSLHTPREKYWGVLAKILPAGVIVRGLALDAFEDWLRQEQHGTECMIGPTTVFFPMARVERLEADETVGPVHGFGDRFQAATRRSALVGLGWNGRRSSSAKGTARPAR
jgi:hypothetical protein